MSNYPTVKAGIQVNIYSSASAHIVETESGTSINVSNFQQTPYSNIPEVGQVWPGEGGVYAGIIRDGDRYWHLILATDESSKIRAEWGGYNKEESGAESKIDGLANTQALVTSKHTHPAPEQIAALTIDGHSDYYLPSQKENNLLYINLPDQLEECWHWSSTQYSANLAWLQDFSDGNQHVFDKLNEYAARAVRRLPI